jgi:hypothetical protein
MTERNDRDSSLFDQIHALVTACLEGEATAEQIESLDKLIRDDPAARRLYVQYLADSMCLRCVVPARGEQGLADASWDANVLDELLLDPATPGAPFMPAIPFAVTQPPGMIVSPAASFPSFLCSYLIAAAVLGCAMLAGWMWKVSEYNRIAQREAQEAPSPIVPSPSGDVQWVGHISGLFECRWADPKTAAFDGAGVPLGRKYVLASGLMEITYDTGAKVILKGPCTYQVEERSGGYLSLGKLTAKLERKNPDSGSNHETTRLPNSQITKSPNLSFSVRTPVATITDLGTEFGVEVTRDRRNILHVFQGKVEVRSHDPAVAAKTAVQVGEGETVTVDPRGVVKRHGPSKTPDAIAFVRQMPKHSVKTFDLVDVLAGGDGFSGRRNRGVNPTNGQADDKAPKDRPFTEFYVGDGKYHRVPTLPLVDGVFIPDGGRGPVVVDSAGHTCGQLPATTNVAPGYVWAGGRVPSKEAVSPTILNNVDYGGPGHGLIFLHANSGITFDLQAIRRSIPKGKLVWFRATAGNSEKLSATSELAYADLWIIVDGRVRHQRGRISGLDRGLAVAVQITDKDRFLTLVSTDGGNGVMRDWIIFGDPRLEYITTEGPVESPP